MTRRELLRNGAIGMASIAIPLRLFDPKPASLKFAVITDIHHGLALDSAARLDAFVTAVAKRDDLAFAMQMGDFCHSVPESKAFLDRWNQIRLPKLHVLGNHDMDKVDKDTATKFWGMKSRYGVYEFGDYRFIILDLNHFKKEGKLFAYDKGNYFTDNATHNWADPEQLDWLAAELRRGKKPTILISHQPLGFANPGEPLLPEQIEVLKVIEAAAKENPRGAVAVCLCGHMHVDRLEMRGNLPCDCVNSASYFWSGGMYAYSNPLFAFMEITPGGNLVVQGASGEFTKAPPKGSDTVLGRSASIANRRIPTKVTA